ncbi:MAG: formyltetrahydrofolate deformylase [Cyanobacteriota bacterium]|jgi:formyltetrahydrofolate deformylase
MQDLTATLLVSCPDQPGIVAKIAQFIYKYQGNIIHADQHTDFSSDLFLNRVEWQLTNFQLSRVDLLTAWTDLALNLQADWQIHFSDQIPRLALWVSKQDHCLLDLLWRWRSNELPCQIPLIISNHGDLKAIADQFGIDFYHFPITKSNKAEQEQSELALLKTYKIDLVVLAKYLQILTPDFIQQFPRIINIHHSFLPAFPGANPYHRAHDRGVKIIGATAHYATAELDEGPIIEQDVVRVSHRDSVADLIRKGRDLERIVLARAVRLHLQDRVLVYGNRTVVFA